MRPEKQAIVDEIRTNLDGSSYLLIAEYRGMKVDQFNDLRTQLRKAGARVLVVKNRLLKNVVGARGWTDLDALLRGQSAMVTGGDVIQTAKLLKRFSGANKVPVVKGGVMDGRCLSAAQVQVLADLPSREELWGMVVRTIAAPMAQLVGVMQQKVASLVYVLKAVEEKKSAK